MARLPGRVSPPWCWVCKSPPGPDCPARGVSPRQVRRRAARELAAAFTEWADEALLIAEEAWPAQCEALST